MEMQKWYIESRISADNWPAFFLINNGGVELLLGTCKRNSPRPKQETLLGHSRDQADAVRRKQLVACSTKRSLSFSIVALMLCPSRRISDRAIAEELELEMYTDSKEGFSLLRPSSYIKVDKAGAAVLFEEVNRSSNSIGVVVSPVRLTSLKEFGSPQFVAEKLIQAEKRKESTKDAEVIAVTERSGQGGLQVYEFEYKVDSTRGGMKRIFSAAFVAWKKLYLLNIAHSEKLESPLETRTRMMLEQVLHSFGMATLT
ncbi:psbP domain-containing protein 2, chloroplastic [Malania oleifera]|uniref:psbP domain-containing protein 2, chloroplastic n=1 Tax=Malania oleifera TaxID=397392 RepID=UPI0025ADBE9F|nr:psbP domain-containing protein 2, chloroplastic [Malania oleifera]XP_057972469.1 psbP domain-containing protein 2, chloroplastic [Malania oleifera]